MSLREDGTVRLTESQDISLYVLMNGTGSYAIRGNINVLNARIDNSRHLDMMMFIGISKVEMLMVVM